MKETTLEQLGQDVSAAVAAAQRERLLITRGGEPVAVLRGIEHKDAEDLRLEADPEFWKMIEERRRSPATMRLEDLKAELFHGKDWSCHYSMVLQWSDEVGGFVASFPDFGVACPTHGATYEEAAANGQAELERLIELYWAESRPLPMPSKRGAPVSAA